jgi:hypothetical protein
VSLLHTVLLSFDPELSPDDVDEMYAQIRAWPEMIGGFEQLAIGPPISKERTRGYQYLLHIVVEDEHALERYLVHPVHQRFAGWVGDRGGLVLAFDYLLDRETVVCDHTATDPDAIAAGTLPGADAGPS